MKTERVAAGVVFVFVFLLHVFLLPQQGLTDDDDFYAPAGIRYAGWVGDVLTQPTTALSQSAIDAAFTLNHEHPPFAKLVFGLTHAVLHRGLGVLGSLDGARAGNALFAAVLAATLILWLWRRAGVVVAGGSVLVLLSLPRFFFHSEVATLDVPVSTMIVVTTALFSWSLERDSGGRGWRRGVVVAIAFGLACLTKLNAPFLVLPCLVLVLCERWRDFDVVNEGMPLLRFPRVPPAIWAMALLAPVVFVVLWPWLWHDTLSRLGGYLAFHLKHYPIFLFYEGEIWNKPFAPASAVLTMAVITVPVVVVVLGVLGGISATVSLVRIVKTGGGSLKDRVLALALLQAVFSVGVVAVSNVPRYGGEKLFMPFFPFWCVLAGQGVVVVVDAVVALCGSRFRSLAVVAVVGAAVLPGFIGTARFFGGYALSYYGELGGGLRGAVSRGHERTYYDVADKELARWLDRNARGRRVNFQPNHKEYVRTYRWLRTDGVISRDGFKLVSAIDTADVVVLTHERRWSTYPALREQLRGWRVLHEKRIDGVPLYSVLERP
ncbi:MAG: phospholipid carrier-dependent glycosyltransferase [Deltaproteobacteria bacterium]|nr:phospholipid carrier-dependent glycosyltransferase [Deltaproteobacteria bacterium]